MLEILNELSQFFFGDRRGFFGSCLRVHAVDRLNEANNELSMSICANKKEIKNKGYALQNGI